MGVAVARGDDEAAARPLRGEMLQAELPVFDKLHELVRHGYLPDKTDPARGESILLHHPSGPDLILRSDGSIDLPIRGRNSPRATGVSEKPDKVPSKPRRMAWLRTMGIVFIFASLWLISVAFTSIIIEGM